jgi:MOSC domain-containing protein YiiM
VGAVRLVKHRGQEATTGIWKEPVAGPVAVRGVNLKGDDQADRRFHGGPDKAVYAYALEDYAWWADELGHALAPGTFGENLTVEGIDLTAAVVGERWLVGTAVLEVRQPRTPCWKLGLRMGDDRFPARFAAAGRPGAYLRIAREGEVGAGDEVLRFYRPDHGPTIGQVAQQRSRSRTPNLRQ